MSLFYFFSLGIFFFLLWTFSVLSMSHFHARRYRAMTLKIQALEVSLDLMLDRQEQLNKLVIALLENAR
jgi:hypothetical protein